MKRYLPLLILTTSLLLSQYAIAQNPISSAGGSNGSRIWFVNPMETVDADFTRLQDAIDDPNVVDGDTIYVEQSGTSHGSITVDKQLTIIGSGYFLWENDSMQANKHFSEVDNVTFNAGSEGSVMMGMYAYDGRILIYTDSIRIQHNRFVVNTGSYSYVVLIDNGTVVDPITRVELFQNYFYLRGIANTYDNAVVWVNTVTELLYIENNIIIGSAYEHYGNRSRYAIRMSDDNATAQIRNNYLYGAPRLRNAIFENNFVALGQWSYLGYVNYSTGRTYNNYANKAGYFSNGTPDSDNNVNNVNFNNEIKCFSDYHQDWGVYNTPDTCFQLKSTATAIDAGVGISILDGTANDVGPYDGNIPYSVSGMPFIPSIFYFEAPAMVSEPTMQVRIKARTHH